MVQASNCFEIYQFRIVLRKTSPHIWRRILVRSESTLADLHRAIQTAFNWTDRYPHRFVIRAVIANREAHQPRLADLRLYAKERFSYDYHFNHPLHDLWHHDIRLEKRLPAEEKGTYPRCIGGIGAAPPEDCGGPKAFEEFRDLFTTRYVVHRLAEMLDEGLNENHVDELRHLRPWMRLDGCDRRSINRRLKRSQAGDVRKEGERA
jgi:hypothetical protein